MRLILKSPQCSGDVATFSSHYRQCLGDVTTLDDCFNLTAGAAFDVVTLSCAIAILT